MRKGLSFDEKRDRVLKYFHDNQRVFNLKELEKLIPKATGVISQSVKEVVQSLVDDRLIDTDKIGAGNFYWAFVSQAKNSRMAIIDKLQAQANQLETELNRLNQHLESLQSVRVDPNREQYLEEYHDLLQLQKRLQTDLDKYSSFNPEVIDEIRQETILCKSAANRWADNILSLKSHCKTAFSLTSDVFDQQFEVTEDDVSEL
ncbi:hypothetical protein RCL1_002173 [Eukaryota sp. TZLM3-RCL]